MDIKDSYLHGTVGVVKSISVNADKLTYNLADVGNTARTVTLPLATTSANGLLSSTDKAKLDAATGVSQAIPYIVGPTTDTAGVWTGSHTGIIAYSDGLTIIYVPKVAGGSNGTTLNINGLGATECRLNGSSKITTHYPANAPVLLTYVGGYWKRADYNSDTNTQLRVYRQKTSYNDDYPLIASRTLASAIGTSGTDGSYSGVYGLIWDDTTKIPTVNPSTGEVKAVKFTGTLDGTAGKVTNKITIKINSGTTEGTSQYAYDGSAAKTLDIKNGTGIGFTNTAGVLSIYNSGVRSISTGTANGTISVNTNGTSANVAVKGLGSAAYTNSTAYAVRQTLSTEDLNTVTTPGFYNCGGGNACINKPDGVDHFGMYVIHCAGGTYYVQILFEEADSTKQWRRHCLNGTWSTWTLDKLTDTTYSQATTSKLGLVKLMRAALTSDITPVAAPSSYGTTRNYAVDLDKDGQMFVHVPWSNTTYSVFTGATSSAAGTSGLVPAPAANTHTYFLRGDGTWATPTNTTYAVFTGATASTDGTSGLVPKPTAGNQGKFLKADGTWATPTNTTYNVVSNSANGLAPKVINTNTATVGTAYYVLASSDGSATPSWYKLPSNAFVNDDTKVTQTNTTTSASYRVLFSGNANDTTETTTARKSANLLFNPSTGTLTTKIATISSQLIISNTSNAQHILFSRGTANGNTNPYNYICAPEGGIIVIAPNGVSNSSSTGMLFSSNGIHPATNNGYSLGTSTKKWQNVYATTLIGNLDGTYVNKLTGYSKATAVGSIAATDSLNTALGKLEYKADSAYELVKGAYDGDGTIENLTEILKVLEGIKDTETIQSIIGKYLPLTGGTLTGKLTIEKGDFGSLVVYRKDSANSASIQFKNGSNVSLGYLGMNTANGNLFRFSADSSTSYKIWDSGIDGSGSGLDADLLDGTHKADLFTTLSNVNTTTNPRSIAVTVGGTSKYLQVAHSNNTLNLNSERFDTGAPNPTTYNGLTFQFSYNIDSDWSNVITMRSYTDPKYCAAQIITPANNPGADTGYSGNMKWRLGRNTTWLNWRTILDSENYASVLNNTYYTESEVDTKLGNYVTLNTALTITGLKSFESKSASVGDIGVSLKLKNSGWHGSMQTAMDFYNGNLYTVPNARISVLMNGSGSAGGTMIFSTQTKHASTNPNPNGLVERMRIDDDGLVKISGALTVTGNTTGNKFITAGGTSSQFVKGDGSLDSTTYLTQHQSLANYVTLNTVQTITASKTFSQLVTFSATPGILVTRSSGVPYFRFGKDANNVYGAIGADANGNVCVYNDVTGLGWHIVLSSNNYTTWINTTNFPGLDKTGTVTSIKVGSTSYSPTSGVVSLPAYPTSLKNPNAIKFKNTAGTEVSYDGSAAVDLTSGVNYATESYKLKPQSHDNVNGCYEDQRLRYFTLSGCSDTTSTNGKRYAGTANSYGFPVSNNANAMLWIGSHSGNYGHQLGFSSDGRIYNRYISNGSFATTVNGGSWYKIAFTSDIPTKTSQLTNDSGFLTSRGYIGTTAVQASSASQNLTGIGNLTMSGNLTITPGNTDNFITFSYRSGTTYSWRLGYLGTGSGDANYLVIQSAKAAGTSWNNVIRMGNETLDAAFGGNVYPIATNAQTLGTSDYKWSHIYGVKGTYTGDLTLQTASGDSPAIVFHRGTIGTDTTVDWRIYVTSGHLKIQNALSSFNSGAWTDVLHFEADLTNALLQSTYSIIPSANNTRTLGTSSLKWSNVYATTFTGNLTGNVTGNVSGSSGSCTGNAATATTLKSTTIVSAKAFSLINTTWLDTGYTFASLTTGTYAIQVTSGTNLVASGIMSVYKNLSDSIGDEIPLHVYGTTVWRPYLRTYQNKLLISSNDASATSRTVTIKIAQIL